MRKILPLMIGLFYLQCSMATMVDYKELSELTPNSSHILHVNVIEVDMVDDKGLKIIDLDEKTGPGLGRVIRLHSRVVSKLKGGGSIHEGTIIKVPLWDMWHYSLRQIRDGTVGHEYIFLLEGEGYKPVYPRYFLRHLSEKEKIIDLINE